MPRERRTEGEYSLKLEIVQNFGIDRQYRDAINPGRCYEELIRRIAMKGSW